MGECKMKTKNSGFTLVEILIVVVILGILAAIVIPQFTQASTEARESSLASNLQTMRSQIELYKIQHLDFCPGEAAGSLAFVAALTGQTDINGAAGTDFGPYLQKLPVNPFATGSTAVFNSGAGSGVATVGAGNHWYFNTTAKTLHAHEDADHYADY